MVSGRLSFQNVFCVAVAGILFCGCELIVNQPSSTSQVSGDEGAPGSGPSPSPSPGALIPHADEMSTCALQGGGLRCWGENGHYEQLDGTTVDVNAPRALTGLAAGVTSVEFGFNFACAIVNGGVKCWGVNDLGQLGDGSTVTRTSPVEVVGLSTGVAKVVAGQRHACALLDDGGVKCWGDNSDGELGRGFSDGVGGYRATAEYVSGLASGVADLFAGSVKSEHTCAILSGGAKCWGYNAFGQLGDGTTTSRNVPTSVSGYGAAGSGVVSIAPSRYTTCLLLSSGAASCWGFNDYGTLGNNTIGVNSTSPVSMDLSGIGAGEKVTSIGLGEDQGCLLTDAGAVYCWGRRNVGQLGDGILTGGSVLKPQAALLTSGVARLSVGRYHACAAMQSGALECWGYNAFGQLGQGNTTNLATPTQVGL